MFEYAKSFCIFKFTMGNFQNNAHDHQEPQRVGNCRLSVNFAANSRNPSLVMCVMTERNQFLAINGQREVIRDYVI